MGTSRAAGRNKETWSACAIGLALLSLAGCASTRNEAPRLAPPGAAYLEEGVASVYSNRLKNHKTANGERYNPSELTAAHPSVPFGTYLFVERVGTDYGAIVRVNDRGPFVSGRIIDLSAAAARRLGMLKPGLCDVRVYTLPDNDPRVSGF